jgi:hypothetical protein
MKLFAVILNIPWSLLGIAVTLVSRPRSITYRQRSLIFRVHSFWWSYIVWWIKGLRGFCSGNVVVLGPNEEPRDLEHELVHIEQHERYPLIFPILHTIETIRFGYRKNRFEDEAYRQAGNAYRGVIT